MKDFDKRPLTLEEDKYTFSNSSQISSQCGLIGYLRADMDTDGNGFFSTWFDYRKDFKTDEFKVEFDEVINSLREEGDILHNRGALAVYCRCTPQARMETEQEYYGVRVDTEKYAYLMRLNPNKGEYNLYCYCYRRDWLDDHIKQARRGIRFIDPNYNVLFKLPDGGKVRITLSDGEQFDRVCRYIDDYHLEVGDCAYHICEYAERMESSRSKVIPLGKTLPITNDTIYTRNVAANILEVFEDEVIKNDIRILCADPNEEAERDDDDFGLYGTEYYGLLDYTEGILIELLDMIEKGENIDSYPEIILEKYNEETRNPVEISGDMLKAVKKYVDDMTYLKRKGAGVITDEFGDD